MRSFFLLILFFVNLSLVFGQKIKYTEVNNEVVSGIHFAGHYREYLGTTTNQKDYLLWLQLEPYIGYSYKNFCFGAIFNYQLVSSNYHYNTDDMIDFGLFTRYFLPVDFHEIKVLKRFSFHTEVSSRIANYEMINNVDYNTKLPFKNFMFSFTPIGFHFRILKNLHIELSTEWIFHSASYNRFGYRIGLEYRFKSKKSESNTN